MTPSQITQRRIDATPQGVGVAFPFYADRAENATIWDTEGQAYTDFAAGIAVLNTGHRHPRVEKAIAAQLQRFTHTAYQVIPYESYVALAERLNACVPIEGRAKTAFFTTGVEAVENAIKFARAYTRRPAIVAFNGAFHGRTLMGMALTGKVVPYKVGFGPFPGDVHHVPYPCAAHGVSVQDSLHALEALFKYSLEPTRVAAIILEPVQGEGGFYAAPQEFLLAIRKLCDAHGIVFIADEVQSGFGRTGKLFAMQHGSVKPDLITLAKSLGGGMPISAVSGRAEIMDAPLPGGIGGTYAGNPMAVAAAHAVLDVIDEEKLCERALVLGERLQARLRTLKPANARIADVRGLGSMVAIEFNDATGASSAAAAQAVIQSALKEKLILLSCGIYGNTIRFLYPLTIPDAQFDAALDIIARAVEAA
jgi:4-aminobutyrate aminotransferase